MKEIILDTETTGLDPKSGHRIIEIGALEMYDRVLTGKKFHFYLNPERDVPQEAYRIHGISTEFLQDKPLFSHVADDFLKFILDGTLVIHNASFDMKFINHELTIINKPSLENHQVIDTLAMARKHFPGAKLNLDALCKRFKVDNSSRTFHGALKDAKLLADVYVELCGGRQSTFVLQTSAQESMPSYTPAITDHLNTKLIPPTQEELALHANFIHKFSK
jgi:DNA polymerase-3 subunit epsilon